MALTRELERCYERARQYISDGAEPLSVVEAGEEHRNYWRPAEVRVLLLAESHVYTKAEECLPMLGANRLGPEGVPKNFIRLVYCLGYGEQGYVGSKPLNNEGTWQYWLILSSCVNHPESPQFRAVLKSTSPAYVDRLNLKINLLKRLREIGVWLLDSSVLALYSSGGGKPALQTRKRILQVCWDEYIAHVVSLAMPRQIVVIGKDVANALEGRLHELSHGEHIVINQPQGLRSKAAIANAYQQYHSICKEHCGR